jgi:thiol-disulfide isomerase/thioredoxin
MRIAVAGLLMAALIALPVLAADDDVLKERKDKFETIKTQFVKVRDKVIEKIKAAKTRDEAKEIVEKEMPKPDKIIAKIMPLIDADPKSDFALTMIEFIMKEIDADDPRIYSVLTANQAKNPRMKEICSYFSDGAPPAAKALLEKVLAENPDKSAQGIACYALGRTLVEQGQEKDDKKALAEGEKYLDRVVKDFGDVSLNGRKLGEATKGWLFELRNLAIGMKVPDTESRDLADKKVKLSDYEGKVVVLDIWATWCGPCRAMIPHEREMVKKLKDKPFAFISLSVDDEKAELEKFLKKEDMPWIHWWQGDGGLPAAWNVRFFPTIYIIDAKGVIRFKNVRGEEMDKAVEKLVKEAEAKK